MTEYANVLKASATEQLVAERERLTPADPFLDTVVLKMQRRAIDEELLARWEPMPALVEDIQGHAYFAVHGIMRAFVWCWSGDDKWYWSAFDNGAHHHSGVHGEGKAFSDDRAAKQYAMSLAFGWQPSSPVLSVEDDVIDLIFAATDKSLKTPDIVEACAAVLEKHGEADFARRLREAKYDGDRVQRVMEEIEKEARARQK